MPGCMLARPACCIVAMPHGVQPFHSQQSRCVSRMLPRMLCASQIHQVGKYQTSISNILHKFRSLLPPSFCPCIRQLAMSRSNRSSPCLMRCCTLRHAHQFGFRNGRDTPASRRVCISKEQESPWYICLYIASHHTPVLVSKARTVGGECGGVRRLDVVDQVLDWALAGVRGCLEDEAQQRNLQAAIGFSEMHSGSSSHSMATSQPSCTDSFGGDAERGSKRSSRLSTGS
jgi:hypothetical protein